MTCFFWRAKFQIRQHMFSNLVFLSCGLLVAAALTISIFRSKNKRGMNEIQKFKEIMRDVLEPRIGGDRSHRSRWWLPRRSIEWDWNVLSLGATATISSGRPDPARRPRSPPSNCLSNHFPPSFYSQKMIKERERKVFLWRLWKRERR